MLPRAPRESTAQPMPEQGAPEPSLIKASLSVHDQNIASNTQFDASLIGTAGPAEVRPATLRVASLNELAAASIGNLQAEPSALPELRRVSTGSDVRPAQHKRVAMAPPASMAEVLPPSGPPQSHRVPTDFPEVSKDTKVILRAIVSSDGKVARVHVVEGDPQLAREAARAVTFWRYSPRAGSGDTESRILFQFAPDVTTVSFLNPGAPKISR